MLLQYYNNALLFSSQFYDGTARSVAMGNAMTALGGDLGALSYNPAASGVYRYTEITLTPSVYSSITNTSFLGNTMQADKSRLSLSNVGWVGSFETGRTRGLVNFNFAITANQSNNFAWRSSGSGIQNSSSYLGSIAAGMSAPAVDANRPVDANSLTMPENDPTLPFYRNPSSWVLGWNSGLVDTVANGLFRGATESIDKDGKFYIPGSLNQSYYRERTGYVEDIIINASGNISDIFFFGVNLTLQSIWMNEFTSISEIAGDPDLFDTGFTDFTREYRMTTSGLGVSVEAGFIVRPVAGLTIGGSISTPTWMYLNETWMESMNGNTGLRRALDSPLGESSYRLTSPFRWNLGVGYTLGGFLALAVDYERTDYSDIFLSDNNGNRNAFQYDNEYISTYYQAVNNVRVGIEAWPIPQLALRLGYNYYSSPDRDFDFSRHYASAGIGFRALSGFFIDLAYQQQCNQSDNNYLLYDSYETFEAPVTSERFRDWKILLTLGWRF